MQPQNNLVTEIILGVLPSLLIIAGAVLLYLRTIDATFATLLFDSALGLFGFNQAFKAPSPTQQGQLNAQQQNLQQLVSYALGMLPGLVQRLSQQQAPVAPPQPAQVSVPLQSSVVPGVTNVPTVPNSSVVSNPAGTGTVSTLTPPAPAQFKQPIQIPDVSMPLASVGQGIPLGQ